MPLSCDGQNNTFLTSSLSSSVPHETFELLDLQEEKQAEGPANQNQASAIRNLSGAAARRINTHRVHEILCTFNHRYTLSLSPHAWVSACTETRHDQ